ncbi:MAG TPA: tRNA (guanosine(46)-N7)-methyltransferase TrmB [Oligoflexia bacterium]|nr:tRNA (guanosine(46)-N7)-methyltransferase TrmB [Oligoflexia bacterium]HMP26515.1 tRNA (guanosine(46)-N7)-methyltransferase TrmB [Oligoflexia bacterium]
MQNWSWINPYITKINRFSGKVVLEATPSGLIQSDRERLKQLINKFSEVFLEIGSGSGGHLLARAKARPEALFVGIELRYKRLCRTAEKAEKEQIENILLIKQDARFVDLIFKPRSLAGIYVYFPDPWSEKRRWLKHRLLNESYCSKLFELLKDGGFISFKTDDHNYYEYVKRNFLNLTSKVIDLSNSDSNSYINDLKNGFYSEFERLFISKGIKIYKLLVNK